MQALADADEIALTVGAFENRDPAIDGLHDSLEARLLKEEAFDPRTTKKWVRGFAEDLAAKTNAVTRDAV